MTNIRRLKGMKNLTKTNFSILKNIVLILTLSLAINQTIQSRHGEEANDSRADLFLIPELSYSSLRDTTLNYMAFKNAIRTFKSLKAQGRLSNDSLITIVDFSKPSTQKRFFIIDTKNHKIIRKELVAHGKNTGALYAQNFSNQVSSLQSSLGAFITQKTYSGKHGYSLKIDGIDKGLNDKAMERAIVIHGADYVSEQYIEKHGRLGRSFGCPALSYESNKQVIDLIKNGSLLFLYHQSLETMMN